MEARETGVAADAAIHPLNDGAAEDRAIGIRPVIGKTQLRFGAIAPAIGAGEFSGDSDAGPELCLFSGRWPGKTGEKRPAGDKG